MSMPCKPWVAACVDAAEGKISEAFSKHMHSCEKCRIALEEFKSDLEFISPEPAPVPGPWLAVSIRKKAEDSKNRKIKRRQAFFFGPALAAAGFLLVLGIWKSGLEDPEIIHYKTPDTRKTEKVLFEEESAPMDDLSPFTWDDDWGMGLESLLAGTNHEELEFLVSNLPE